MLLKKKETSCCSGESSTSCCSPAGLADKNQAAKTGVTGETGKTSRKLKIDFLYLDLEVCTRCQGTGNTLDEAIGDVANVLQAAGIEVLVNKVNVISEELAIQYQFVSSPTIRIDGRDIAMDVKENLCESCGDLCGDSVDCRVWTWQGVEYDQPPKAMVIDAILKAVYGAPDSSNPETGQAFQLPDNLHHFYTAMKLKRSQDL